MSSVFHIIQEEYDRLNEAIQAYEAAIAREEQGSPQIKRIGNKDYLYLAKREGAKVKFHYVGHADAPKARKVRESIDRRRKFQELLIGVKKDLKEVRKALRGKV